MAYPNTNVATSHVVVIQAGGSNIGLIQSWSPSQSRTVTPYYEINPVGGGEVAENIPGVSTGLTIQISMFELYTKRAEQVWGPDFNITMLVDQTNPLTITEKWRDPTQAVPKNEKNPIKQAWSSTKKQFRDIGKTLGDPSEWWDPNPILSRIYVYEGFWFTSLGRTLASNDDRIVKVNATGVYQKKTRVQ